MADYNFHVSAGTRQQRVFERIDVKARVELVTAAGKIVQGMSRNISRGGLCLDAPQGFAMGEILSVRITLVFGANRQSEALALPAVVVWSTAIGASFQVGTQFRALSQDQSTYLDMFLRYLAESQAAKEDAAAREEETEEDDPFAA